MNPVGTITTGVIGQRWRASVTPWGAVEPWDGTAVLDWYVAADDRWHVPAKEPSVRQQRVDGTAVVETRVRIPQGDAVQQVYSVADGPGYTVMEIVNESPMPIAVAFDRADVCTERPVGDVPIQGIDLPSGSFVLPIGHRATARVAIAHDGAGRRQLPSGLPSARQVANGWITLTGQASQLTLPDASAAGVVAARCELALGCIAHGDDDAAGFLLGLAELARMGERLDPWLPELSQAVERLVRRPGWDVSAALDAAARVLHAAGEPRALGDLQRLRHHRMERIGGADTADPLEPPEGVRFIAWLERRLARDGAVLPGGFPPGWLGVNFDVRTIPIAVATTLSYAIRWHGERPALLWELAGEPVRLSAPVIDPDWSTTEPSGEALLASPPGADSTDVSFS
jgi:hypothetical protein